MTQTKAMGYDPKTEIKARIFVRECETRDGRKFLTYKILEKTTHRRVDLRFTRDVNPPTEDCWIVVPKSKINRDNNREYPCYWVREVSEVLPLTLSNADVSKYFEDIDEDDGND